MPVQFEKSRLRILAQTKLLNTQLKSFAAMQVRFPARYSHPPSHLRPASDVRQWHGSVDYHQQDCTAADLIALSPTLPPRDSPDTALIQRHTCSGVSKRLPRCRHRLCPKAGYSLPPTKATVESFCASIPKPARRSGNERPPLREKNVGIATNRRHLHPWSTKTAFMHFFRITGWFPTIIRGR